MPGARSHRLVRCNEMWADVWTVARITGVYSHDADFTGTPGIACRGLP